MAKVKSWDKHVGPVLDTVNGFDVIKCAACGFTHIVPIPSPEDLERVYRHEYYSTEKPLYLERTREDLEWWNLVYSDRYDTFEELLPRGRRRILDIGSGPGIFLHHGKCRGWETLGIEPSAQAAAHSRELGIDIVQEFITEDTALKIGHFDVVHMSMVLEHIPDPIGLLRIARDLLKPDGVICVVVPNDYSFFQEALRNVCGLQPWWVAPPHHINYFDFDSLASLFHKINLNVVAKEATFPIDLFLLMGDNYVGNDEMGRVCHSKRKALESNLAAAGMTKVKRDLYRRLADTGIGREVCMYGRKLDKSE